MNMESEVSSFSATDQPELALVEMRRGLERKLRRLADAVPPPDMGGLLGETKSSTELLTGLKECGVLSKNLAASVHGVLKLATPAAHGIRVSPADAARTIDLGDSVVEILDQLISVATPFSISEPAAGVAEPTAESRPADQG
ncbi:MAG: hypothetical protein IH865_00375 [Chloroflexi bacterium]|nr:hypothetical protein [Chloroflexota bacterium]